MSNRVKNAIHTAVFHPLQSESAYRAAKVLAIITVLTSVYFLGITKIPDFAQFFADKQLVVIFCGSTIATIGLTYILFAHPKRSPLAISSQTNLSSVIQSMPAIVADSPMPSTSSTRSVPSSPSTSSTSSSSSSSPSSATLLTSTDTTSELIAYGEMLKDRLNSLRTDKERLERLQIQAIEQRTKQTRDLQELRTVYEQARVEFYKLPERDLSRLKSRLISLNQSFGSIDPEKLVRLSCTSTTASSSSLGFDPSLFELGITSLISTPQHKALLRLATSSAPTVGTMIQSYDREIAILETEIANLQRLHFEAQYQQCIDERVLNDMTQAIRSQEFENRKRQKLNAKLIVIEQWLAKIEDYQLRESNRSVIGNILKWITREKEDSPSDLELWLRNLSNELQEFEQIALEKEIVITPQITPAPHVATSSLSLTSSSSTSSKPSIAPSSTATSASTSSSPVAAADATPRDYSAEASALVTEIHTKYIHQMTESLFNFCLALTAKSLGRLLTTEEEELIRKYFRRVSRELKGIVKDFSKNITFFIESLFVKNTQYGFIPSREYLTHLIYISYNNKQFDIVEKLLNLLSTVDYNNQRVALLMIYKNIYYKIKNDSSLAQRTQIAEETRIQDQLLSLIHEIKSTPSDIKIDFSKRLINLKTLIISSTLQKQGVLLNLIPDVVPKKITKGNIYDADERLNFREEMEHFEGINNHSVILQIIANELIPVSIAMLKENDFKKQTAQLLKLCNLGCSIFLRNNFSSGYTFDDAIGREVDFNIDNIHEKNQRAFLKDYPEQVEFRKKILKQCVYDVSASANVVKGTGENSDVYLVPHPFYIFNMEETVPTLGVTKYIEFGHKLDWRKIGILTSLAQAVSFFQKPTAASLLLNPLTKLLTPSKEKFRKDILRIIESNSATLLETPLRTLAAKPEFDARGLLHYIDLFLTKSTENIYESCSWLKSENRPLPKQL